MTDAELTRLAATTVMGWQVVLNEDDFPGGGMDFYEIHRGGKFCNLDKWQPLHDWRAAGEIVDKMRADGWLWDIEIGEEVFAVAYRREEGTRPYVRLIELPRAITIAALKAVGAIAEEDA